MACLRQIDPALPISNLFDSFSFARQEGFARRAKGLHKSRAEDEAPSRTFWRAGRRLRAEWATAYYARG